MTLSILGIGTAQPEHHFTQDDLAAAAVHCSCANDQHRKLLPALYRRTTVDARASVVVNSNNGLSKLPVRDRMLAFYPPASAEQDQGPVLSQRMKRYSEEALPLAERACRAALNDAGVTADQVSQIVVVSCTGFSAPGVDIGLIESLNLPRSTGRTLVGFMGCHGAMNGLRVADGLAASDDQPDGHILLCCVELCTLHFQYGWDPQRIVANALFADGAAAVVAKRDPLTHASNRPRLAANASYLLPDSKQDMSWHIRDHGFEMTLSPRVPNLIQQHLPGWLHPWLASQGLATSDIQGWAIHPGGPRVIRAVETALDLPESAGDTSRAVLRECGNMSSPTVLFILQRLMAAQTPRPYVALAFGPGLTIEAALFK